VRRFTPDERRARLGLRHRLAHEARAGDPVAAAEAVVALHSTDPTSVVLSALARMRGGDVAVVERALYGDRSLVRVMGMRRTVFVAAPADAALVLAACGRDVAARERRRLAALLGEGAADGPGPAGEDVEAWLAEAEQLVVAALRRRGEATAAELGEEDERLRVEVVVSRGAAGEVRQRVVSRLLTVLAARGDIVRARPRGSWSSTQFRWAALDAWCPAAVPRATAEASRAALARRWLERFGPATVADVAWWTGWGMRDTRAALAGAGAVEVDLDGAPGVALAGDLDPVASPAPWAALLPALDPTPMGWKDRAFCLGEHGPRLFDTTGNASPTVWWCGRVVGGWAQRADGEVVTALLEDVGADAVAAVAAEVARVQRALGPTRLAPRARGRSAVETALLA
jgi:hypothetical protein